MRKPYLKYKTLFLAISCCMGSGLFAQYECSIKNFNTENGLPLNEVTAMTMGHDGYLWVGTRSGVVRYDGSTLKTFTFDNNLNNTEANYIINTVNTRYDKKTMVRTRAGFVYLIEKGKPVVYIDTSVLKEGMAMYNGNFPSVDIFRKYFLDNKVNGGFANWVNLVREIIPVNERSYLFASAGSSNMAYMTDGKRELAIETGITVEQFLPSGGSHFLKDPQGMMYLFDRLGKKFNKIKIDLSIFKKPGIASANLRFFADGYSNESFCFYDGTFYLLHFDAANNSMKFIPQFTIKDKSHYWTGVVYDRINSSFFLSTANEGFFQVKLKKIKTFNINEMLPGARMSNAVIYAMLKTSDSTVIIPSGFQFTVNTSGVGVKKLGDIYSERETIALLGKENILATDAFKIDTYTPSDGYQAKKPYNDNFNKSGYSSKIQLMNPEGDSVWVCSDNDLFYLTRVSMIPVLDWRRTEDKKYMGLRLFYRLNKTEALVANEAGLYRIKTSYPYSITAVAEMAGKQVRHIHPYKDMFILSVYKEGLYIQKGNQFYKVPLHADQLELSSCHSTYIDKNGYIWIPTDKGLFKSTASSLVDAALNPGSNYPFFFCYNKTDGIDNIEFNGRGMPTYVVLNNGQAFYPSMGGVVTFNMNDLSNGIVNAPVVIEKILIDNKTISASKDSIYLKPGFKYLSLQVSTPNFGEPKNLVLEYSFDNGTWKKVLATDNQQITLVDISSGTHKLNIRKRTGFGNTDYVYTSVYIFKAKEIYERWWFYVLLLALLAFIIWFYSRFKTRSINNKRKVLQKKVDEQTAELSKAGDIKDLLISIISHDMVSPLRHVSLVAQILEKGLEPDPEKVTQGLSDIKNTSQNILSGSLSIINWMKYNNKKIRVDKSWGHLHDMVNEALAIYIPIANSNNIKLSNEVPESALVQVDHNIFSIILANIVSNAIKYSASAQVQILFDSSAGKKILMVRDTGKGMIPEILNTTKEVLKGNLQVLKSTNTMGTGLGYIMISELAKIHGLHVTIDSELDKGTEVSIIFPDIE